MNYNDLESLKTLPNLEARMFLSEQRATYTYYVFRGRNLFAANYQNYAEYVATFLGESGTNLPRTANAAAPAV